MSDLAEAFGALGITQAEIDAAAASGTLLALAAERFLLPGERKFDVADVAERTGLDRDALKKLWFALGFPGPSADDKAFTDSDIEWVRTLLADGTTVSDYTLHEARVISAALARIAEVFIDEMWDDRFAEGQTEMEALGEMAAGYDVERIEGMLLRLLRRHLVAAIYRRLALGDGAKHAGMPTVAVGFADAVGFTTLSQSLSASELTRLVVRFEQFSFDLVAEMGGRIVKTIGDEVMFLFDEAAKAGEFALRLAEHNDDDLPPIRVGLGWGPVLVRQGDCFGPTVNLASRVVGVADGGEVVVDRAMMELLAGNGQFTTTAIPERDLKGFGPVALWRLQRPT
jgi:adenylate cyclase